MKKDGGSAFPNLEWAGTTGMSLRDYFAAAALPALIVDSDQRALAAKEQGVQLITWIAMLAYSAADAMLAEREKE